jgi:hypothetical protein
MRRSLILALAVAFLFSAPSADGAPRFRALFDEYLRTGLVNGCAHSEEELQAALTSIPADIAAYDPSFADALNTALENRAGGCAPRKLPSVGGAVRTAADGSPGPPLFKPPPSPAPAPSGPSALPLQLLIFGVFAAVALIVLLLLAQPRSASHWRRKAATKAGLSRR